MKCASCGFETDDDVRFCPECGTPLEVSLATTNEDSEKVMDDTPVTNENSETPVTDSMPTTAEIPFQAQKPAPQETYNYTPEADVKSQYDYAPVAETKSSNDYDPAADYYEVNNYMPATDENFVWACWVGFGCALGSFCFNPCGLTLVCAFVFSIIGLCGKSRRKGFAIAGLIISGARLLWSVIAFTFALLLNFWFS